MLRQPDVREIGLEYVYQYQSYYFFKKIALNDFNE